MNRLKRALLLAAAGLVLLGGCSSEAGSTRSTETTEAQIRRVICIGDSNTYGFDPYNFGARYGADVRWTSLLETSEREVVNLGVNGATIPRELELDQMRAQLASHLPAELVIVMLGTNDILCTYPADTCVERMDALLSAIKDEAPEAAILLIAPPATPLGDAASRQHFSAEYAALTDGYRALAERRGIRFADAGGWSIGLGPDELHFSAEGHAAFAVAVEALLTQEGED